METRRPQRFILLGHGRSGSTLVLLALRQHPDVQMYGEVLTDEEAERSVALLGGRRVYREREDADEYLREVIFRESDWPQPLVVGFKVFYNHARKDKRALKAWNYLINERSIRVIHLVRHNLFECCISHEVAYCTNVWARKSNDKTKPPRVPPFRIDPYECKGFIETMLADRAWAFRTFKAHPHMVIEYEQDVSGDFERMMNRIFDFLDVPALKVRKILAKQAILPPHEQVSNFHELKEFFAHTDYASFFNV